MNIELHGMDYALDLGQLALYQHFLRGQCSKAGKVVIYSNIEVQLSGKRSQVKKK